MEVLSEKTVQTAITKFGEEHTSEDTLDSGKKSPDNPRLDKCTLKVFKQEKESSVQNMVNNWCFEVKYSPC